MRTSQHAEARLVQVGLSLALTAAQALGCERVPVRAGAEVRDATAELETRKTPASGAPSQTQHQTQNHNQTQEPRRSPKDPRPAGPPCALVDPPTGFVDLAQQLPSAILAMGYHGADNFTGAPLPGYEGAGAWLERDAAQALSAAAIQLAKDDLRLVIFDAYRPRRASQAMVDWTREAGRESLLREGWIAPRSAHNRGQAVDVGLVDAAGEVLDMGSPWDHFGPQSRVRGVDGPALERRLRLRAAMVGAGFVPYPKEWWHFSHRAAQPRPSRDLPYACR